MENLNNNPQIDTNSTSTKPLNLNDFVQMVRDDMMAGAAPDEYPTDEKVRIRAKAYYNYYLQGDNVDDLF